MEGKALEWVGRAASKTEDTWPGSSFRFRLLCSAICIKDTHLFFCSKGIPRGKKWMGVENPCRGNSQMYERFNECVRHLVLLFKICCTNRMEMFRSLQSPPSSRTVNVLLSESLSAVSDKVTYWAVGSKAKNTTREQPRDLWPLRYLIRLTTSPTHQTGQTHPSQVPQLTWSSGWGTWLNSPNSPNWPSSPQLIKLNKFNELSELTPNHATHPKY